MSAWSTVEERRRLYVRGLSIRAVAAGVFAAFFGTVEMWAGPLEVEGRAVLMGGLGALVLVNLPMWWIGRWRGFPAGDLYCHWCVDVLGVSAIVYSLGLLDVPLSVAGFIVMIVSSAIFSSAATSFALATLAGFSFVAMIVGERVGVMPHRHVSFGVHWPPEGEMVLVVGALVLFFLFAFIAGTAASQLRELAATIARQKGEIEEGLRREENARATLVLLGRLVQHDVWGPLSFVWAACGELERELAAGERSEALRWVRMIRRRVQGIEGALGTLSEFSEPGHVRGAESTNVGCLVRDVVEDLRAEWEERSVRVSVEPCAWPWVLVERPQVYHVVRNVLSNAVKWAPNDGTGEVRVKGVDRSGRGWELVIEDNGPGLIGEGGGGTEAARKERGGPSGLGIGLRLAREIARGWGGEILHSAREVGGAAFSIVFPEKIVVWDRAGTDDREDRA